MPKTMHCKHEISTKDWVKIKPALPGEQGSWGGVAHDNKRFINAVFWVMQTGSSWRSIPSGLGGWRNTHRRFIRWRDNGIWEKVLEVLIDEPGYEWLMGGGNFPESEGNSSTQNCIPPWMRMVCRSSSLLKKVQKLAEVNLPSG